MKFKQLFLLTVTTVFLLLSLQSCRKSCATCHHPTTEDVQQICEQGPLNNGQYRETIENFEGLGYNCFDD